MHGKFFSLCVCVVRFFVSWYLVNSACKSYSECDMQCYNCMLRRVRAHTAHNVGAVCFVELQSRHAHII
jgi:hypothetical protein